MKFVRRFGRISVIGVWLWLLYLIAANIQAGWLYVVIAFFLIVGLISIFYPIRELRGLEVSLALPVFTERNAETTATLFIRNPGKTARFMVRITSPNPDFVFLPEAVFVTRIPARGRVSVPVRVMGARRGRRGPKNLKLSCAAPVGIFAALRTVPCAAETLVYPTMKGVADREPLREFALHDPGPASHLMAAQDPYHYTLREYVPGDNLRDMHWKLTARLAKPVMRAREKKVTGRAVVIVDNLRRSYPPDDPEVFEQVLERALAAARHLLRDRNCTVTVRATASTGITLHNESAWEHALQWFALVELEEAPRRDMDENARDPEADYTLAFGAKS